MNQQSKKSYTAKLTGNRRDTHLTVPKTLLVDVRYKDGTLFRDHLWVLESYFKELPKSHYKRKQFISFNAIEKPYPEILGDKIQLISLSNIKFNP